MIISACFSEKVKKSCFEVLKRKVKLQVVLTSVGKACEVTAALLRAIKKYICGIYGSTETLSIKLDMACFIKNTQIKTN